MTFGRTTFWFVMSVVGASVILAPVQAVPVVPNFTQGSMTSHTETTQKITETINSMDYSTGYQYSVTGSGVKPLDGTLKPTTGSTNVTIDGVTSAWTGVTQTPTFVQVDPGATTFSLQKVIQVQVFRITRLYKERPKLQA